MKEIQLSQGQVSVVDDNDYEWLNQWKWHVTRKLSGIYYVVRKLSAYTPAIWMHREIVGAIKGEFVDHANGDTLDNTRGNLRKATASQNAMNRKKVGLGYKGTHWSKVNRRWFATIEKDGKKIHLGCFGTSEDAAHAYDEKAKELFGEFSRLNFP